MFHSVLGWKLHSPRMRRHRRSRRQVLLSKRPARFSVVRGGTVFLAPLHKFDFSHFHGGIHQHPLCVFFFQIFPCICCHSTEFSPFIHGEFPKAHGDIQSAVVLLGNSSVWEFGLEHLLMSLFTALNFSDKATSCFCKRSHAASDKIFPPFMLLGVSPFGALACADANKHSYISSWPLIDGSFLE